MQLIKLLPYYIRLSNCPKLKQAGVYTVMNQNNTNIPSETKLPLIVHVSNINTKTRRSKIVIRATGRRAVTSVDHSRCAVVLKEIQRYHGPGLWAWRKTFSPLRGTNSTTTHCHIFLVQYLDRYHRGCCCGPFEAEQPKRY